MIKWFESLRLQDQSAHQALPLDRRADHLPSQDRGRAAPSSTTISMASCTRSTASTGRSGSVSCRGRRVGASRTNFLPNGAMTVDARCAELHGRSDWGAHPDRAARTRRRRRRDGVRMATLHNEDYIKGVGGKGEVIPRRPRHPHRRYRDHPARRRRHPADRRRGHRQAAEECRSRINFPKKCPCYLHTDIVREETATGEEGARARCTGEFACPFQKIEHLKLFVLAPGLRHRGLGRKADRTVLRERMGEGAGRYLHASREAQARSGWRTRRASAKRRCATCSTRSTRGARSALDRFIYALGIRHVGETTALALARGYGSWKAFHDAVI